MFYFLPKSLLNFSKISSKPDENHLERDVVVEKHVTIEAIINGDDLPEVPDI